jgi:hypothetical protein
MTSPANQVEPFDISQAEAELRAIAILGPNAIARPLSDATEEFGYIVGLPIPHSDGCGTKVYGAGMTYRAALARAEQACHQCFPGAIGALCVEHSAAARVRYSRRAS